MRKTFIVTEGLPTIHVYIQRNIDTMTRRLQEKYGQILERRPLFLSGDGNCLFNAMSVTYVRAIKIASAVRKTCDPLG